MIDSAQDGGEVVKSDAGFKIDVSYFEPKKEKSFINSSKVGVYMVDNSMASFDLGDRTLKYSKTPRKIFFSKSKNEDKKSKIKSYQQLLKNENKKI